MNSGPTLIATRAELIASGHTGRSITAQVRSGALIRVRRDHYAKPTAPPEVIDAVRVGGRLTCLSALKLAGVFVYENRRVHVHLEPNASRLRLPSAAGSLRVGETGHVRHHWAVLRDAASSTESIVGVPDALAHSLHCQAPQFAIATLDNALYLGLVSEPDVETIFEGAPTAVRQLRRHIDGRSEAGQETIIRLLLIAAGLRFEIQVRIAGVGRVDFVVEGVLVIEADSRLAHDGWELHRRDRRRDLLLAQLGFMTIRPVYEHTMFEPELVMGAILGLLRTRPREGTRGGP